MSRLLSILLMFGALFVSGCSQRSDSVRLRVMSYNIHHGEGVDRQLDLERIAAIVRRAEPDLVALQEVDRNAQRTRQVDQPACLAELTGMHVVFEKNINLQGGEYGNAVLSRLPIMRHENHYLPRLSPTSEQRGLLEVHVQLAGGVIVFFATHFDHRRGESERLASVAMLRERVGLYRKHPVIVAGDLNAEPDSAAISAVTQFLTDCCGGGSDSHATFPAGLPEKRIDFILHNQHHALRLIECRVLAESVASDHRPILAVFELDKRRFGRE